MSYRTPRPQRQGVPATSPKLAPGPSLGTAQTTEDVVVGFQSSSSISSSSSSSSSSPPSLSSIISIIIIINHHHHHHHHHQSSIINQSISQSVNPSIHQSINQSINPSIHQSINPSSINPINPINPINHSINRASKQSIHQLSSSSSSIKHHCRRRHHRRRRHHHHQSSIIIIIIIIIIFITIINHQSSSSSSRSWSGKDRWLGSCWMKNYRKSPGNSGFDRPCLSCASCSLSGKWPWFILPLENSRPYEMAPEKHRQRCQLIPIDPEVDLNHGTKLFWQHFLHD